MFITRMARLVKETGKHHWFFANGHWNTLTEYGEYNWSPRRSLRELIHSISTTEGRRKEFVTVRRVR